MVSESLVLAVALCVCSMAAYSVEPPDEQDLPIAATASVAAGSTCDAITVETSQMIRGSVALDMTVLHGVPADVVASSSYPVVLDPQIDVNPLGGN